MSIPIVNDHSAINRRLREIQAGDVAPLPSGIFIMLPCERLSEKVVHSYDTIFAVYGRRLSVHYGHRRELVRQRITELAEWLLPMFPSTRRVDLEICLSEQDFERMLAILRRLRRQPL